MRSPWPRNHFVQVFMPNLDQVPLGSCVREIGTDSWTWEQTTWKHNSSWPRPLLEQKVEDLGHIPICLELIGIINKPPRFRTTRFLGLTAREKNANADLIHNLNLKSEPFILLLLFFYLQRFVGFCPKTFFSLFNF